MHIRPCGAAMIAFMHACDKGDFYNFRLTSNYARPKPRDVGRMSATRCAVYCAFDSCFLKSAGTVNASALAPLFDTETNCEVIVMRATSPGGTGTGVAAGVGCAAGDSESSFFLWKRPPSLPAIAPARPLGLPELSLSEPPD